MAGNALRCKIYFAKDNLPFIVERRLCQDLGFFVVERMGSGVVLGKRQDWYDKQQSKSQLSNGKPYPESLEISEERANELNRRCCRTYDAFSDPVRDKHYIKTQLHNFAQGLNDPLEVEFVENWIYNNVF